MISGISIRSSSCFLLLRDCLPVLVGVSLEGPIMRGSGSYQIIFVVKQHICRCQINHQYVDLNMLVVMRGSSG